MKNKNIDICFVTDNNYAQFMGVAITSILKNAKRGEYFNFYIFDDGILNETKQKLQKLQSNRVNLKYIDVTEYQEKFENLKQAVPHISKTSYLKFIIPEVLSDLDKIIYLDCDLIVKFSLAELFNTDLKDNLIGAVEDVGYTYWSQHNEELKLKFKCMNSGVMLINCDLWRKEHLSEKLFECASDHDKVGFGQDQPVLNYILKDRVKFISFNWNVQDTFFRDEIELKDREDRDLCINAKLYPRIIHYTYIKKPWQFPLMVKAQEYWDYYKLSPFYEKAIYKKAKKIMKNYNILAFIEIYAPSYLKELCKRKKEEIKNSSINMELDFSIKKDVIEYLRKEIYYKDKTHSDTHTLYKFLGFRIKIKKRNYAN